MLKYTSVGLTTVEYVMKHGSQMLAPKLRLAMNAEVQNAG